MEASQQETPCRRWNGRRDKHRKRLTATTIRTAQPLFYLQKIRYRAANESTRHHSIRMEKITLEVLSQSCDSKIPQSPTHHEAVAKMGYPACLK